MLRLTSLFILILFASFAPLSTANESFRVLENETRLVLAEKQATVSLAIENPLDEFSARIRLEILAPDDSVQATREIGQKIGRGKQNLSITFDTSNAFSSGDALLWYRLHYEIVPENASDAKTDGIISFSRILPEVFELKMVTGFPFAEKMFRARVQTVNPANQKAVADVEIKAEIKIEGRTETVKVESKTDAEGFAVLDFNLPKFETNTDLNLKITGRKNGLTREVEDEIDGLASTLAEIVTDKPIYQPDQTVKLRLYYYNQNRLPVSGGELTVEIENEETDEKVFAEKIKTSRFGIASAVWKIPEVAKLGVYRIRVKHAEDEVVSDERIKVTRYDLPNFYVEAGTDRKYYLPGQATAKVEIKARYLFGKVVPGARVRVVSQDGDKEFFKEITGTLDDEGKFSTEIDLSRALKAFEPGDYRRFKDYRFSAYVTDPTTNRTEPRSFDVRITDKPVHVYLVGATHGRSSRLPADFYATTFYADGTPAACEVGVYESIGEDADGRAVAPELGKLLAKVKTNSYGAAKLKLPVQILLNKDELDVKLVADDGKGLTGSFEADIETEDEPAIQIETGKTIHRKGEPIKVSIVSSKEKGAVFVETWKDFRAFDTMPVKLTEGRAEVVLPYREEFKNTVDIIAYFEPDDDEELIAAKKSVIYPTPTNLEIEAKTGKEIYRPGEQVAVKFRSRRAGNSFAETALGVLVVDKAVEDRARTQAGTSAENSFLNRTFVSPLAGFFGQEKVFGDLTARDIKNLDVSKPLSPELELAVEIALETSKPRLELTRSRAYREDLDKLFNQFFAAKMKPVAETLDKIFEEKGIYPTDEKSLREILSAQNIDFGSLKDAWGNDFRADFRFEREFLKMTVWSFGADELADTADDLTVLESKRGYFQNTGKAIDKAMREYTQRTGGFITDYRTLREELRAQNIDTDRLRDPWGSPYRFEFTVDRTNYLLTVRSSGIDRRADILNWATADDFTLWTSRADYFIATRANLIKGFNEYVEKMKTFPRNETEMKTILQASGFNTDEIKDVFGRPYYVRQRETLQSGNIYRYQSPNLKVVRQKLLTFAVRSAGQDGVAGNYDDFDLASFTGATREEEVDAPSRRISGGDKTVRQKTTTSPNGAISGTLFDLNGAVIPGATLSLTNFSRSFNRSLKSDENGYFLFDDLPRDVYALTASSPGFRVGAITNLAIEPGVLLDIEVVLDVGSASETVTVTTDSSVRIDPGDTKVDTTVTVRRFPPGVPPGASSFTPRVRDYFAETLVWVPELVTDKKGDAELKFKMADNLTTWKLYAIGSDENGDFGVVEKELQTFQPFFAELEPPRVLTEGDRIALPVPVRNYTNKKQKVAVSMAENDWSRALNGASQTIEIPANGSVNAVFDFQAAAPIADGKQRVTAIAGKDGDAIEKPVTVRPNGQEIVETASDLFEKESVFDVNFPANAFANTRRTEIKIYPNMFAHVAESVEGLLQRPYGCGEQTTSSTYPNLMILKIEKKLGKDIDPTVRARAQSYLEEGYRRLLNYQTDSGGFSFWGKSDAPDAALTAYVLRFLTDARGFIEVDAEVIEKAENWLLSRQNAKGGWDMNRASTEVSTAYILRSLSRTENADTRRQKALQAGIGFLKKRFPEMNDAFVLANLALVALPFGDAETARAALDKLEKLSQPDKGSLYWTTASTPFYGWGKTADIETTALVVQAVLQMPGEKNIDQLSSGLRFLLKNKDRFGVWHSTQTTVNVLDALILMQKARASNGKNQSEKAEIFINGRKAGEFPLSDAGLKKPFILDASPFVSALNNRVEIKISGDLNFTMAQIVSKYYISWDDAPKDARYFDLKVEFDKLKAQIGDEITCRVRAQKKDSRWGMILTEIGLPPGADVDRTSLEKAKSEQLFSSYDILPDRVIVYSWVKGPPLEFSFKFRPRFGLNAQTPASVVYDYYNEEARATVAPVRFEVK